MLERFTTMAGRSLAAVGVLLLQAQQAAAETPAAPAKVTEPGGQELLFWVLVGLLVVVLLTMLVAGIAFMVQMRPQLRNVYELPTVRHTWSGKVLGLFLGDATLVRGEVHDELLNHDYDGIHEFDNDLPPWWKYSFYATIAFAVGYLGYYHVLGTGQLQGAEYAAEMQQAALLVSADADDPNTLTTYQPLSTPADLGSGKTLFATNCAPCHGASAEGKVGPNLTDDYWLHGGEVNHVYKTIKFGVTGKGMVAWKGKLSGKQILQVSSYILSLQGSKPANAKESQGKKETMARPLASR
jgi:cytochrome c oxidase cbb3-type subunit 3